jgi:flagellar basal body-associated protein FliL
MEQEKKEKITDIIIFIIVFILIVVILIAVLVEMGTQLNRCEGQPDNYTFSEGVTCGEFRAINTSEAFVP